MRVTAVIFPEAGPRTEAVTPAELKRRGVFPNRLFRFLEEYRVQVQIDGRWRAIICPAGFETDWASIPAPVQALLANDDPRILPASVPHDRTYEEQGNIDPEDAPIDRETADEILFVGMLQCGASRLIANLVYAGVRAGGGSHWKPSAK